MITCWRVGAGTGLCGQIERKALGDVVINVLAEQATVDGTSDHPGYLPGFGLLPAESVRDLAADGRPLQNTDDSDCGGGTLSAIKSALGVCEVAGSDVSVSGLRGACRSMRHRPQQALPVRADPSVEYQAVLPHPPSAQDVLRRLWLGDRQLP